MISNSSSALLSLFKNRADLLSSGCLVAIHERVSELIREHEPECAAFEAVIFVQSYRTAITLGTARGAALLAAAARGLPIYEYAPRRVKQPAQNLEAAVLHAPRGRRCSTLRPAG